MDHQEQYYELSYYTLAHPDPAFIHQHIVDAYAVQYADETTKPIELTFALIGLYLCVERGCSGKEVQRAHIRLANQRKHWPTFTQPADRGAVTVSDVLANPPGPERDQAIHNWCASVWQAYGGVRDQVIALVEHELGL